MAANKGVPPHFFDNLGQSRSSKEDLLCFLEQLDPSLAIKKPAAILLELMNSVDKLPHCLELILSSGPWADILDEWLKRSFPARLPESSVHVDVTLSLVHFILLSETLSCDDGAQASIQQDLHFVSNAPNAIQKLLKMRFEDIAGDDNAEDEDATPRVSIRKKTQVLRKKQAHPDKKKRKMSKAEEHSDIFRALGGWDVPRNPEDAQALVSQFTTELERILRRYLEILRTNKVAEFILASFVQESPAAEEPHTIAERPLLEIAVTDAQPSDVISPAASSAFEVPLKASLYFDSADDFGDWEIFLSGRAIRDIRAAKRRDNTFYEIIMKKIKELSHSHFSRDNLKPLTGGNNAVPIFEAKMTNDSRLVYQIDCVPDPSGEQERQVIRIFGVYSHTQLNRLWESLGYQLAASGGQEYRDRCCKRVWNRDKTRIVPAVFPPNESAGQDPLPIPELPKDDLQEIHSILVLEKFVGFSQELRNSFIADLDVQHVFDLSPQEMKIIEHPHSCYVIGRSGTGKTTTMVFKMLGLERTFLSLGTDEGAKPRQLFVTKSPVLATRVEDYFARLLASLSLGQKSESELRDFAAQNALRRAVKAPKSMLHKKDMRWKASLPARFSLLQEDDFPLFLTFDRLVDMVVSDILAPDDLWVTQALDTLSVGNKARFQDLAKILSATQDCVTYPIFLGDYWAHFPQDLIKGLDPALVFSEIIGVIKGSEESLAATRRILDKARYLSLSDRCNYLFTHQREQIYKLFAIYSRMKREKGALDAADRTHAVLEVFNLVGVPGTKVEFLYVDEAQDNMLIDAMLLRSMCKNPRGLFWAGDTAQTIAVGNSFRFQDLKAFLFRIEERRLQSLRDTIAVPSQQPADFALAINYRSHEGIIACARSIVEILVRFWPTSLDRMARESGKVLPNKPLFFGSTKLGDLEFRDFMSNGESEIEFGAAQCVLVRDKQARKRFLKEVGEIGIIMSVYDSKGLEFDDVLLYDFFSDSTLDESQWRVLLNLVPGLPAPQFDEARHAGLCSELKFLYVAITRARQNLWIYDSSSKGDPLRTLWDSLGLIESLQHREQLPQFAAASTCQEWQVEAEELFDNENYSQAVYAFKRAELEERAKVAQAYQHRQEAETTVAKPQRKKMFSAAAKSFVQCAGIATEAGDREALYNIAGNCWLQGEDYVRAADAYLAGERYVDALRMYRKVAMFDRGVSVIQNHGEAIKHEPDVVDFKQAAKVYYLRDKRLSKADPLFEDDREAMLAFTEENPFLDESRALILIGMQRYEAAADVHLAEGRLLDAIRLLLSTTDHSPALTSRGHRLIIQGLWKAMPFGSVKNSRAEGTQELLDLASNLSQPYQGEAQLFWAFARSDWAQARVLGSRHLRNVASHLSAILCFSYALHPSNMPDIRGRSNADLAGLFSDILGFCSLLRHYAENLDLQKEETQQLFNFSPANVSNIYIVPSGTWLHGKLHRAASNREGPASSKELLVAAKILHDRLKDSIFEFIAALIARQEKACQEAPAFVPCLRYLLLDKSCRLKGNCPDFHIPISSINHQWLTAQIRIHLQQVVLCHFLEVIPKNLGGRFHGQKFWIRRLHQTLNPPVPALGSWSSIKISAIPEAEKAIGTVKNWCRDILSDNMTRQKDQQELSIIFQAADLLFHLDRQEARRYVHNSNAVASLGKERIFLRAETIYTIPELLGSLDGSHPWFLRGGLLFVQHVLDARVPIDVNILCSFMEYLTGAFVVAYYNFRWHKITLPRKQILHLHRRLRGVPPTDIRGFAPALLEVWGRILHVLASGENSRYLLHFPGNLTSADIRYLLIPRVCQGLCLVGYNIANEQLQQITLRKLETLTSFKRFHPLFLSFTKARTWSDVKFALWRRKPSSPLDDLVELWSMNSRNPNSEAPKGVTRVGFQLIEEIPNLLQKSIPPTIAWSTSSLPGVTSNTMATGPDPEYNIQHNHQPPSDSVEDMEEPATGAEGALVLDDSKVSVTVEPASTVNMTGFTMDERVVYSPEQMEKASFIRDVYKTWNRRRQQEKARARREVACRAFFDTCLQQIGKVAWPPTTVTSVYQKLFLGVVPHLLVVIQWVQVYVLEEERATKVAFKTAKGFDFEKVMARSIRVKYISKTLAKLRRNVEPHSPFHAKHDLKELRKVVTEVEELFRRLPKAMSGEVEFDMAMAKPPTKVDETLRKPPLNWDEDEDHFYNED